MSLTPEREQEIRAVANGQGRYGAHVIRELLAEIDALRAEVVQAAKERDVWKALANDDGSELIRLSRKFVALTADKERLERELREREWRPMESLKDYDGRRVHVLWKDDDQTITHTAYALEDAAELKGWLPLPAPPTTEEPTT